MSLKIEMFRTFRTVVETGTLSGAAEILGRTPSALSMTLAQLEAHIGAPLFESDRKNRLTPLGLMVLDEAGRAIDAFDRSVDAIARYAHSTAGTVRLATVPSAATSFLPEVIRAFRAEHPEVRLEISDVDTDGVKRRLQFDQADLGIISAGQPPTGGGVALWSDTLGILCHPQSPIATDRGDGGWRSLTSDAFVANPLCELIDDPIVTALVANARLSARNTTTLLSFVRAGLGATVLPDRLARGEAPDLTFILPADQPVTRHLVLLDNPKGHLSPASMAFRTALIDTAADWSR